MKSLTPTGLTCKCSVPVDLDVDMAVTAFVLPSQTIPGLALLKARLKWWLRLSLLTSLVLISASQPEMPADAVGARSFSLTCGHLC